MKKQEASKHYTFFEKPHLLKATFSDWQKGYCRQLVHKWNFCSSYLSPLYWNRFITL